MYYFSIDLSTHSIQIHIHIHIHIHIPFPTHADIKKADAGGGGI